MRFWKFQYHGQAELLSCIEKRILPTNKTFPGLNDTYDYPASSMKPGDGVLLARLEGNAAKVFAVGKVRATGPVVIDWAALAVTLYPSPQGGLTNWQEKSAFEISANPAKRYGLRELIETHVGVETEIYDSESDQALEGYLLDRTLLASARNAALAKRRKELDEHTCQACLLHLKVGERHVIEVHHLDPLKASGETVTTIDKLVSLCPTCHRLAHLRNPPYEVRELRDIRSARSDGNA